MNRRDVFALDFSQEYTCTMQLDNVTADITKLAKFNSLNYTAFLKVLKKHDKLTNIRLKNTFLTRLTKQPFYKETFDAMIVRLSALYEKLKPKDRPELAGNVCCHGS